MNLDSILTYVGYPIGAIVGLIAVYFTWKIYGIKFSHAKIEEEIAKKKLEALATEAANRQAILNKTDDITTEISDSISQKLIDNPTWLDRFMDQTGVTYNASVYGKRIGHFYYEKDRIARDAILAVEQTIRENEGKRFCLIIDSGTTMYPVFQTIAKRVRDESTKAMWRDRVCIVTNNIPGIQFLMKNAKANPNDEHSEVPIACFVMPGKPLSVYAAITGSEAVRWLLNIRSTLDSLVSRGDGKPFHVMGFVTGNYMARHSGASPKYFPVARGEGHVEVKRTIVEVSDEILLLSPLMKFSFATVDLLNMVNGFVIPRTSTQEALQNPKLVKYEEILIPDGKPVRYFSTRRRAIAKFHEFGELLHRHLRHWNQNPVSMPEFDIRYWAQAEGGHLELEKEIPHEHLREQYEQGKNIWDWNWVEDNPNG